MVTVNSLGLSTGQGHCVLGKDTLLSQCLSTTRCINFNARGKPVMDLHSIQGG